MRIQINENGNHSLVEVDTAFAQQIIDGVSSIALSEVDKMPMGRSSLKAILRTAMMFYKVRNPDPSVNDIDFLLSMMKEKAVEFLDQNVIEVDGVIHRED